VELRAQSATPAIGIAAQTGDGEDHERIGRLVEAIDYTVWKAMKPAATVHGVQWLSGSGMGDDLIHRASKLGHELRTQARSRRFVIVERVFEV
jgi:hypothetical protein